MSTPEQTSDSSTPEQSEPERSEPELPASGLPASGLPEDAATLLAAAATRIVAGTTADTFLAWFVAEAPTLSPELQGWLRTARGESLDRGFGRALWNRFPRPETRFRPCPLPAVGRNDPCPCDSGRKFKRCCLATEPSVETMASLPLLLYVLDALPDDALDAADISAADPDDLLEALDVWGEEGAGERVVRLVAPLFGSSDPASDEAGDETGDRTDDRVDGRADGQADGRTGGRAGGQSSRRESGRTGGRRLPRHAPELLETLFDHWPSGYRETLFATLSERWSNHRDDALASIATLTRVRASIDNPTRARALLKESARRFAGHPEFDEIEIDLLNAEGRVEEAVRLATTLGERLVRADPADPMLADHAEALLERATWVDPEFALERDRAGDDVLDRLIVLLEETPPAPVAGSHAPIAADRELVLAPSTTLALVESAWQGRFGGADRDTSSADDGHDGHDAGGDDDARDDTLTRIVEFLDDEPLALSSFRVLDALAREAGGWGHEPWADALQVRVLERSETLLYRHVSREVGFETPEGLPDWDAMVWDTAPRVSSAHAVNREALDLLAGLIAWHRAAGSSPEDRTATLLGALQGLDRTA